MRLLAGLGNPGQGHAGQRHNIGFMAADAIARRHSFSAWRNKFKAETCEGMLGSQKVLIVKPQTYMNRSGESVGEAMRFYKLQPSDLFVLYDELDLAPGKVRVKIGGGAGGHNGIRSLDSHCGNEFHRVRIGIGHPGDKRRVQGHVLGDFAKQDHDWLDPLLEAIAEHAPLLLEGGGSTFMNRVSLAMADHLPAGKESKPAKGKGQSHIRQARPKKPAIEPPRHGPMAEMLRKLFGD